MTTIATKKLALLFASGSLVERSAGAYQSIRETGAVFHNRGHEVTVVGTIGASERLRESEWGFAKTEPFRKIGPASWHVAPDLRNWLEACEARFDAVSLQAVWLMSNVQVAKWAHRRRIPYMITAHGNFNGAALEYSSLKKWLARRLLLENVFRRAACLQALNEQEYRAIRAYGIKRPVCVIPNGVTIPALGADHHESIVPVELQGKKVLLYLGRLHTIKNIEGLLRAWSRVAHDHRDWRLVIAGGGPDWYRLSLMQLAKETGAADSIHFTGFVEGAAKSAWWSRASAFVLPSFSEGQPVAAMEAMAAGLPVLLTRSCNLSEIEEAGAGILTGTAPERLADDLRVLLCSSENELREMGGRARLLVESRYGWERVCDQLEAVYAWMRKGGPAPSFVRID